MNACGCSLSPNKYSLCLSKPLCTNGRSRIIQSSYFNHSNNFQKFTLFKSPPKLNFSNSVKVIKRIHANVIMNNYIESSPERIPKQNRIIKTGSIVFAFLLLPMFFDKPPALALNAVVMDEFSSQIRQMAALTWPKILSVLIVIKNQGMLLTLLLGLSAFFSMAETSITTLWPWKVRELAEKEGETGVFNRLRKDVTRFLTTILIGTTVVNIAATALVTDAVTSLFGEAGISTATAIMTVVQLILTEITPKSFAAHNAIPVARFVIKPISLLSFILYPIGKACTTLSMFILKLLHLKSSGEPIISEEELKLVLRGAELSGIIEEEEQDMIENVLDIKDTYVRDVMTPLVDMVAINTHESWIDFANIWENYQYSRVPVFEDRVDNIIGIAYAKDIIHYVQEGKLLPGVTKSKIAHRPAFFVPDSMSVWDILREFTIRKIHMAIVLNEYGGTIGLVTLEDVVEEIVGEIFDENDSKEEIRKRTGYVIQRGEGIFDVDANTSIEDFCDALHLIIPEGPYETVSGFACHEFGCIPRMGDFKNVRLRRYIENSDEETEKTHNDEITLLEEQLYSSFCMKILAGTARKVSIVRFELKNTSNSNSNSNSNVTIEKERTFVPKQGQRIAKSNQVKQENQNSSFVEDKEARRRKEFIWDWKDDNNYPKTASSSSPSSSSTSPSLSSSSSSQPSPSLSSSSFSSLSSSMGFSEFNEEKEYGRERNEAFTYRSNGDDKEYEEIEKEEEEKRKRWEGRRQNDEWDRNGNGNGDGNDENSNNHDDYVNGVHKNEYDYEEERNLNGDKEGNGGNGYGGNEMSNGDFEKSRMTFAKVIHGGEEGEGEDLINGVMVMKEEGRYFQNQQYRVEEDREEKRKWYDEEEGRGMENQNVYKKDLRDEQGMEKDEEEEEEKVEEKEKGRDSVLEQRGNVISSDTKMHNEGLHGNNDQTNYEENTLKNDEKRNEKQM